MFILSFHSTNCSAPNKWVFTAQLVEHCSANVEAMGSNPVRVPKFFFFGGGGVNLQLLKLQLLLQRSYLHLNIQRWQKLKNVGFAARHDQSVILLGLLRL